MKVILKADVKKVGKKGQLVDVSDGYARNFLIAKGLAVQATERSMEILDNQKEEARLREKELEKKAIELKEKLATMKFEFRVKSGKEGRVFGSVSTKQIVSECAKRGITIDKKKIIDTQPISSLGTTRVKVELYKNVIGEIICHVSGTE